MLLHDAHAVAHVEGQMALSPAVIEGSTHALPALFRHFLFTRVQNNGAFVGDNCSDDLYAEVRLG